MTQAYSACDTLANLKGIIASQQKSIDGSDRLPYLIMSRKEGDLFHALPIGVYRDQDHLIQLKEMKVQPF